MNVHYTIMSIIHRCWIARDLGLWERTGKLSEPAACLVLLAYDFETTNFVNILFIENLLRHGTWPRFFFYCSQAHACGCTYIMITNGV